MGHDVQRTETSKLLENLVHLSRLALQADKQQVEAFVRRLTRILMKDYPDAGKAIEGFIGAGATTRAREKPETSSSAGMRLVPVDRESRWDLLNIEVAPFVSPAPIMSAELSAEIEQVIAERLRTPELMKAGLEPSRTVLFTGPPGVGKTLTAHWMAQKLNKPLFTLDLASVMSSLLGKTGNNLRAVLEYAKANDGVLFLDEFDAVAKRRNDDTEVGELKRLVTVILQEVDKWPANRLLIAATNHGELLDPAIWRRFDAVINFPLPDTTHLEQIFSEELGPDGRQDWARALAIVLDGQSYSDAARTLRALKRQAVLTDTAVEVCVLDLIKRETHALPKPNLKALAVRLESAGIPQRQVAEMTGLSRDTIRRARNEEA